MKFSSSDVEFFFWLKSNKDSKRLKIKVFLRTFLTFPPVSSVILIHFLFLFIFIHFFTLLYCIIPDLFIFSFILIFFYSYVSLFNILVSYICS